MTLQVKLEASAEVVPLLPVTEGRPQCWICRVLQFPDHLMNDDVDTIWKRFLTLFQQSCNPAKGMRKTRCSVLYVVPMHVASRAGRHRIFFNWLYSPLLGPRRFFHFPNPTHSREYSSNGGSARRNASTYIQYSTNRINSHRHPHLELDSNPRPQCSSSDRPATVIGEAPGQCFKIRNVAKFCFHR
jgi:hypothetical protein